MAEQVTQLAQAASQSAEEIVQEAVRRYLAEVQRTKIHADMEAFEQQLATLRQLQPVAASRRLRKSILLPKREVLPLERRGGRELICHNYRPSRQQMGTSAR